MTDLVTALGLMLVIEGALYALFPDNMRRMTAQIANTIQNVLQPDGVGVVIKAEHHCMTTRGVH